MEVTSPSYKGHRYPAEVVSHCVWLYFPFPLSYREVEELILERGVIVPYETDTPLVSEVRAGLRERASPQASPARRQTASRRSPHQGQR
ncbi:hypothetical protein SUDANB146_00103 [Streptomyces sp. enrichment culture]